MKRLISALLAIFTIATLICVPVVAETEPSKWDGKYEFEEGYTLSGEGTATKPYLIQSAKDLAFFAYETNTAKKGTFQGKVLKQTVDIDLDNQPWTPIGAGSGSLYFYGTYDGDYHAILNMNSNSSSVKAADKNGLFGILGQDAHNKHATEGCTVIKNLALTGKIENTYTSTNNTVFNLTHSGAIASIAKHVKLENIYSSVEIKGIDSNSVAVGGLIGNPRGELYVESCVVTGNVSVSSVTNSAQIGGIIGSATEQSTTDANYAWGSVRNISNSYYTGTVTVNMAATGTASNIRVGGIAGAIVNSATIRGCYMLGKVQIIDSNDLASKSVGAFVGHFGFNPSKNNTTTKPSSIIKDSYYLEQAGGYLTNGIGNSDTDGRSDVTKLASITEAPAIPYKTGSSYFLADKDLVFSARQETNVVNDTYSVRLLSTVSNIDNYKEVGYIVRATKDVTVDTTTTTTHTQYKTLSTQYVYKVIKAGTEIHTATSLGGSETDYILALAITDIPDDIRVTFEVTPYGVTTNGATVYGQTEILFYEYGAYVGAMH